MRLAASFLYGCCLLATTLPASDSLCEMQPDQAVCIHSVTCSRSTTPLFFRKSHSSCLGVSRLSVLGRYTEGYCLYTAGFEKPSGQPPVLLEGSDAGSAGAAQASAFARTQTASAAVENTSCAAARAAETLRSYFETETSAMRQPDIRSGLLSRSREAKPTASSVKPIRPQQAARQLGSQAALF